MPLTVILILGLAAVFLFGAVIWTGGFFRRGWAVTEYLRTHHPTEWETLGRPRPRSELRGGVTWPHPTLARYLSREEIRRCETFFKGAEDYGDLELGRLKRRLQQVHRNGIVAGLLILIALLLLIVWGAYEPGFPHA